MFGDYFTLFYMCVSIACIACFEPGDFVLFYNSENVDCCKCTSSELHEVLCHKLWKNKVDKAAMCKMQYHCILYSQ